MASVPYIPMIPPSQDFTLTKGDRIRVTFSDMNSLLTNGGSQILSYDLWRDDGN